MPCDTPLKVGQDAAVSHAAETPTVGHNDVAPSSMLHPLSGSSNRWSVTIGGRRARALQESAPPHPAFQGLQIPACSTEYLPKKQMTPFLQPMVQDVSSTPNYNSHNPSDPSQRVFPGCRAREAWRKAPWEWESCAGQRLGVVRHYKVVFCSGSGDGAKRGAAAGRSRQRSGRDTEPAASQPAIPKASTVALPFLFSLYQHGGMVQPHLALELTVQCTHRVYEHCRHPQPASSTQHPLLLPVRVVSGLQRHGSPDSSTKMAKGADSLFRACAGGGGVGTGREGSLPSTPARAQRPLGPRTNTNGRSVLGVLRLRRDPAERPQAPAHDLRPRPSPSVRRRRAGGRGSAAPGECQRGCAPGGAPSPRLRGSLAAGCHCGCARPAAIPGRLRGWLCGRSR